MSAEAYQEQRPMIRIAVMRIENRYSCRSDDPSADGWVYWGGPAYCARLATRFNHDDSDAFGPWYVRHEQRFISEWRTVEP